jgi:hypothetical protein
MSVRRLTTACSGRGRDKVPEVKRWQRVADAGRYAAIDALFRDSGA